MAISSLAKSGIGTFNKFNKTSVGNPNAANALFVMGGSYSGSTGFSTSSDGITWTLRSMSGMGSSNGITKVGNYYFNFTSGGYAYATTTPVGGTAVYTGEFGRIGNSNTFRNACYSNNQWTWWGDYGWAMNNFIVINGGGTNVTGIAYGNGTWVIVRNGVIYSQTSNPDFPQGVTYTSRTAGVTAPTVIAFANGLFVVGGQDGITTSTDGITWTARPSAGSSDYALGRILHAGGIWFAVRNTGSSNLYTSPDGITWTAQSPVFSSSVLIAAAYGNGVYTVMSNSGLLWSSPDGTTWTSRTNPQAGSGWWNSQSGHSTIYFG